MSDDSEKVGEGKKRQSLRFYESDYEKFKFWAAEKGVSVNEFIVMAVNQYIAIENGNYPLETLEQQRLNQLIDEMRSMSDNMKSLSSVVLSSMSSITQLANGSNFMLESD